MLGAAGAEPADPTVVVVDTVEVDEVLESEEVVAMVEEVLEAVVDDTLLVDCVIMPEGVFDCPYACNVTVCRIGR